MRSDPRPIYLHCTAMSHCAGNILQMFSRLVHIVVQRSLLRSVSRIRCASYTHTHFE